MDKATEPTKQENEMYMEFCAALISMMGEDEVLVSKEHFMDEPFQVWRRATDDGWLLRVVREK